MARSGRLSLALLLLAALSGCRGGAARAWDALERARRLDAQVEGAAHPEQVAAARDRAWQQAEARWQATLTARPNDAEAHLALALIAWQARQDAAGAGGHLQPVIAQLSAQDAATLAQRRPGGRTGAAVLAEAYALRAAITIGAGDGSPPPSSLVEAAGDAEQAVRLDPRPDYQRLRESIRWMQTAARDEGSRPLDPGTLQPRDSAR